MSSNLGSCWSLFLQIIFLFQQGGWMASPIHWTWIWVNSGSWWWTGRPGMLQSMGSQRVGHDWVTELNRTDWVFKPNRWNIVWLLWRIQVGSGMESKNLMVIFQYKKNPYSVENCISWIINVFKYSDTIECQIESEGEKFNPYGKYTYEDWRCLKMKYDVAKCCEFSILLLKQKQ